MQFHVDCYNNRSFIILLIYNNSNTVYIVGNFHAFKISWIDWNKDVNHYFDNFSQSTKANSHENFSLLLLYTVISTIGSDWKFLAGEAHNFGQNKW